MSPSTNRETEPCSTARYGSDGHANALLKPHQATWFIPMARSRPAIRSTPPGWWWRWQLDAARRLEPPVDDTAARHANTPMRIRIARNCAKERASRFPNYDLARACERVPLRGSCTSNGRVENRQREAYHPIL